MPLPTSKDAYMMVVHQLETVPSKVVEAHLVVLVLSQQVGGFSYVCAVMVVWHGGCDVMVVYAGMVGVMCYVGGDVSV